jgi:hypothetical protein
MTKGCMRCGSGDTRHHGGDGCRLGGRSSGVALTRHTTRGDRRRSSSTPRLRAAAVVLRQGSASYRGAGSLVRDRSDPGDRRSVECVLRGSRTGARRVAIRLPIDGIRWAHAQAFCQWMAEESALSIRLPTEDEWERAARGDGSREYPWGEDFETRRANLAELGLGHALPVGALPLGASAFGVLDMAGNVDEWTSSEYTPYPGAHRRRACSGATSVRPSCHSRRWFHALERSGQVRSATWHLRARWRRWLPYRSEYLTQGDWSRRAPSPTRASRSEPTADPESRRRAIVWKPTAPIAPDRRAREPPYRLVSGRGGPGRSVVGRRVR